MKENANIAFVRTKKANKIAVRRLKKAEKLLKERKKEEFYDEVLRAVWGYLSDKLNIPQANLIRRRTSPCTRIMGGRPADRCKSDALFFTLKASSWVMSTVRFLEKASAPAGAEPRRARLRFDTLFRL